MRFYRFLLRLCPASLRNEYGAAMEKTFARRLADGRALGVWRRAQLWRRELTSVAVLAASERYGRAARERQRRRVYAARWKAGRMDGMALEIRQATRRLARSPMFTLAAVCTLALAIGATASIFAVVQRVVLNPLPYPASDRLIELDHGALALDMGSGLGLTPGLYFHYANRARTLDSLAIYQTYDQTVAGNGEPERVRVGSATPSLATVLRVSPVLGRWFTEPEGEPGASQVAILSHELWVRRYESDPAVLGRSVLVEGVPTEVIGVLPPSCAFPDPVDSREGITVGMWVADRVTPVTGFGLWDYEGVARLRDDVSLEDARTELNGLIGDVALAYPNDPKALGNV